MYITYLKAKILISPTKKAQIALLVIKKVTIPAKYLNFIKVFLKKLAVELPKCFFINKYLMNLESDKQPLYKPIYSLESVELETFKT